MKKAKKAIFMGVVLAISAMMVIPAGSVNTKPSSEDQGEDWDYFKQVYNLKGGIDAWIDLGFPVLSDEFNTYGHFCGCEDSPTSFEDDRSVYQDFEYREKEEVEEELMEIRKAIKENNANWTADYTSVSNVTYYNKCGWSGCIEEEIDEYENISFAGNVPDEFDWRDVNGTDWTTSIKSQGGCGSCVAFATIGALESVVQISIGCPQPFDCDLSEAHLFFCGGGSCDSGWSLSEAINYLKSYGVTDEACFPYHPRDMPCSDRCSNWRQRAVKVSYVGVISPVVGAIQEALLKYGPLLTRMDIYEDFSHYRGGIYEHVWGNRTSGHGIAIIGYNNDPGYWICKNSWGSGWGEKGCFRIKYGECGIGDHTYYFSGISGNIQPFAPSNPFPYNEEINVDIETDLSWTCDDPDGDDVYYDIYLAKNRRPRETDIIARHHPSTSYHLKNLEKNSAYYWKVVAEDEHGSQHEGPIWRFATIETTPPSVEIINPAEGYLYWGWLKIPFPIQNSIVIGEIEVEVDASDPGSGVNKVEFYVNDVLRYTKTTGPYKWEWDETSFGLVLNRLKVIAYDNAGNSASDETRVRIFNP